MMFFVFHNRHNIFAIVDCEIYLPGCHSERCSILIRNPCFTQAIDYCNGWLNAQLGILLLYFLMYVERLEIPHHKRQIEVGFDD